MCVRGHDGLNGGEELKKGVAGLGAHSTEVGKDTEGLGGRLKLSYLTDGMSFLKRSTDLVLPWKSGRLREE